MKSFHKNKFLLFVCMIVFLFQTGCTDDLSISETIPSTTQEDTQDTEMDLTQIQAGDYSSLLGTWKEIAYADNRFDGTGVQWHTGGPETFSVSTDKIAFNAVARTMQGNTLSDLKDSYFLLFKNDGNALEAHVDFNASRYWSVEFYPKGSENNLEPNNGVQIDNTKNLIVVYYIDSDMHFTTVFELETECTDDSSLPGTMQENTQDTEMDLMQIQAGDYSSLLGTWKEVAYADNRFDGTGQQWHVSEPGTCSFTLSVSTDKIEFCESSMIMQGNTLTEYRGDAYPLSFDNDGNSLDAHTDFDSSIFWSVEFYPKGAENTLEPNNGVQIDNTKNLIVVYYSGMRREIVFAQE